MGHGTGILVEDDVNGSGTFLLTCYHVAIGRQPRDPAKTARDIRDSPDELQWRLLRRTRDKVWYPEPGGIQIDESVRFIEHRGRVDGIDLVAIRVGLSEDLVTYPIKVSEIAGGSSRMAGTSLAIVGFPFDEQTDNFLPICKGALVASESAVASQGVGLYLVDGLTRPGMSGSPIYTVDHVPWVRVDEETANLFRGQDRGELSPLELVKRVDPSKLQGETFTAPQFAFAGIYCGRMTDGDEAQLSLGIAVGPAAVAELFNDPVVAQHPYPPAPPGST